MKNEHNQLWTEQQELELHNKTQSTLVAAVADP